MTSLRLIQSTNENKRVLLNYERAQQRYKYNTRIRSQYPIWTVGARLQAVRRGTGTRGTGTRTVRRSIRYETKYNNSWLLDRELSLHWSQFVTSLRRLTEPSISLH